VIGYLAAFVLLVAMFNPAKYSPSRTYLLLIGVFILLAAAGAIVGLALGIVAVIKASVNPNKYGGKGKAVTGIVLNAAYLCFVTVILIMALPNLIKTRRGTSIASNEKSALNSLRRIATAEKEYMSEHGSYAALDELRIAGFAVPWSDAESGYRFEVKLKMYYTGRELKASGYEAVATPVEYNSTGRMTFYVSEDFVIRMADRGRAETEDSDPPPGSALDRYY
jgi:hypothetical protein